MTTQQKIQEIEDEMNKTQKNKATAYHLGQLKAKLAKLKRELIAGPKQGGPEGTGFDVSKSGDSRVGMIGFPSVGKSTLLTKLTDTQSKVASYEFTTLTCIPGNIFHKGAKIQLLDLPGIIEGAKDGKGRGRQVIAVARTCNLICIVLDATKALQHKVIIEKELEGFGIRLNKKPPQIEIKNKDKGGLNITHIYTNPDLDNEIIRMLCREYKVLNADVTIRGPATEDDIIDVLEGDRKYIPCIYALNKIDDITLEELEILDQIPNYVPISAHLEWNLDGLIETFWEKLDLLRLYTKPKGKKPDFNDPVCIPAKTCTVQDFCHRIHRKLMEQFSHALVWGTSVKYSPQICGKDHVLHDEDIIQIIKKVK
ncbi:TGS-like protein [Pseudocohnilembus persalinus]|uniref:TGS-like protein n=1 Tax=Pseudocohnilembus persalinus TaxID=266149 RepID=A0A0V0R8K0_PSEPJ|nr:TGS-like protein [Pseudocohnilembus persalinus]|eukprot:KRX10828.1 TGS-like protein [Pseudocohnilembus persalinus]